MENASAGAQPGSAATQTVQEDPAQRLGRLWRQGERPDVDAFLVQAGPLSPEQLAAVLRVDQRERWQVGERLLVEAYLERYPRLREHAEPRLDLVYSEFVLRRRHGETPTLGEYRQRFPAHGDVLQAQLELDQALESGRPAPVPGSQTSGPDLPTVAGYQIVGELGRGAMGVVYRAWQTGLNRLVALKMIRDDDLASAAVRARFRVEAEAVGRLQHPHIVQIFEVGEHEGRPFFAMEFVDGGSLAEQLDGTPWPPRPAAELLELLARAIHYAHSRGIVHRDLKPANILLQTTEHTEDTEKRQKRDNKEVQEKPSPSHPSSPAVSASVSSVCSVVAGTPKITDFGLAKFLVGGGAAQTQSGAILGTPHYMAPEQTGSRLGALGPAADVYGLGAILYELLTGRPPFEAATLLELLEQVRTREPLPPGRLQPQLPRDLETICLKCLQKEPAKRYVSALALAEDLRRFRAGEPIEARPVSQAERLWRWCRRNPVPASLVAVVATLLLAAALGATGAALQFRRLAQATDQANKNLEANLYFHRIALTHRELSRDNLGRALEQLDQCPEGLRQWEWYYLKRLCRVDPLVFRDKAEVNSVAFSPDGELLASAGGDGTVKVWNSRTGAVVQTVNAHTDFVLSVAFHPDGKHLASASADREVKVWDVTTGTKVFACPGNVGNDYGMAYGVAFSPDGRRLAAGSNGAVNVWDWRSRQLLHTLPGHAEKGISVAFSSAGRLLASGSWDGSVILWDADTGERLHTFSGHHHPVSALTFSRDGRRLASASFDRLLKVWDVTTGQLLHTFRDHVGIILGVAFSPDGRRLASAGEPGTVRLWEATTGQEVLGLRGHLGMCQCVAFSPDGLRLASAGRDATIRLWDAAPLQGSEGQEAFTFSRHTDEVWSVAFSPDGRQIVSAGFDKPVQVWDARTGQVSLDFGGHPGIVFCAAWHPDGQRIASAGWRGDGRKLFDFKVWDARTGREAFAVPGGAETLAVAFSPDGRHLVTGGTNRTVQVWDARTGREVGTLGTHDRVILGLAFSPDGRHLASAGNDGTVKLWDSTRLGENREARHNVSTRAAGGVGTKVAFSRDGRRLVTGGEDNTVKIWDVQTGQELQTLRGHTGNVWAVAFSPDPGGRWVASAGEDSTVKVWDSHTGTLVRSFRGHTGFVTSLAFSPDGRLLVSGSRDKTVKVWDLTALHVQLGPAAAAPVR